MTTHEGPPLISILTKPIERKLVIDENWFCKKSGDCCTKPSEVVMTKLEAAAVIHAAPKEIALHFRPLEGDGDFVALKAGPCPLFVFQRCLVYESRPYNCRRFACMRPDPKTEPFRGNATCTERMVISRKVYRLAHRIQRIAKEWALSHGWKDEEPDAARPHHVTF